MNKFIVIVASCSILAAPLALACEPKCDTKSGGRYFEEMDSNKDGTISKKEFDAFHSKHFKELDANKDGKVTQEEMQAAHPQMHERGDMLINKRFDAADTDHDGALSREEAKVTPMILQHFDEFDSNKDGKVTQEEIKAMMERNRSEGNPGNGEMMRGPK
jgi:Ca2+-binding EF-hand superfamily protein